MEDAGRVSGKKKKKDLVGSSLVFVPSVGLSFHSAPSAFLYRSLRPFNPFSPSSRSLFVHSLTPAADTANADN